MMVRITEPGREHVGVLESMELTPKGFADRKNAGKTCYDVAIRTGKNRITRSLAVPEEYIEIKTPAEVNLDAWEHNLGIKSDPTMCWDERRERAQNKLI